MNSKSLWKPVSFSDAWAACKVNILEDVKLSWLRRRNELMESSEEYREFLERIKRRHAIETGIVENIYDLKRGVTEMLISDGFQSALLSHDDSSIPANTLFAFLSDHMDAINMVFDYVREERPLTTGFIKELHALLTRNQAYAEGRDSQGNKIRIDLIRGEYKQWENNPVRPDGEIIAYCPPLQTASEMDELVRIYHEITHRGINPAIIAAWLHHAFTTIHPFQDGNGRVVRLLASMVFIKHDLFPIVVRREDRNAKYIDALEKADDGYPQSLVTYFAEMQRHYIEDALNIRTTVPSTFTSAAKLLSSAIKKKAELISLERQREYGHNLSKVFYWSDSLIVAKNEILKNEMSNLINDIHVTEIKFTDTDKQHYYKRDIVEFATHNKYYFNSALPKAGFKTSFRYNNQQFEIVFSIHHYGYSSGTLAMASFLIFTENIKHKDEKTTIISQLKPYVFSAEGNIEARREGIEAYLEDAFTEMLARIAELL